MDDDEEVVLKPVVAFAAGLCADGVALQLDAATTAGQLVRGEGDGYGFALTADGAIELGQALLTLGHKARSGGPPN